MPYNPKWKGTKAELKAYKKYLRKIQKLSPQLLSASQKALLRKRRRKKR